MRIGMALVVIADLFIRISDLTAHYTNEGLWPTYLIRNFGWNVGYWSFHAFYGSFLWELFLFIVHFVFAFFLLLGYKTKLSTFIVWIFTISLHNRNIYILQSGDDLLRLTLFWGLFLPWDAYYSVDSKKTNQGKKQSIAANVGYLLLIASVYFFSVNLKTSSEWRGDGNALYYALSLEQLRLPIGSWLYHFPLLMKFLTRFVFYLEFIIPVLIVWPSRKGYPRFIAFICILLLHSGIALTLYVGLFFVIGMVSSIGLLPTWFFDKIETKLKMQSEPKKVFRERNKNLRFVLNAVCTVIIFISLLVNLGKIYWFPYKLADGLNYPVNVLRLNQYWGMFSPTVLKKDGWFVYHGMDSIGRQWDLWRNQDYVNYHKPERIVNMYKSDRWRKLAENLQNDTYTFLRPLYCKYVLRTWNKDHPEKKIQTLNLYFMEKESLPDYKTTEITKKLYSLCDER
jgi:hypothetical protein